MTLNGIMVVILRYFSEFDSFRGALRKISRSLSHLLMSSCITLAWCSAWNISLQWIKFYF